MLAYQWGRFVYWTALNSATIQALAAVATVLLTAVLAAITCSYVRTSRRQLLLLAQPNIVVETKVDATTKQIAVNIYNNGAYPFRLRNVEVRVEAENGQDSMVPLPELARAVVGSGALAHTRRSIHGMNVSQESLDCGAFEDWLYVEFDCEDLMELVSRRYGYSIVNGLKEVGAPKGGIGVR